MGERSKKMRPALIALLSVWLCSAPQLAVGRERCSTENYGRNRGADYYGNDRRGSYRESRNSPYRDYGYRDTGYRDRGYASYGSYYPESYGGYRESRSAAKSAAIIGGGAAAGAAIGGL